MTPSGSATCDEAQRVADVHLGDVDVEVLGHLHRQRLDVQLVGHLREHAAFLDADRLADAACSGTVAWIGWSRRTSCRSTWVIVPRTLSSWYSLSTEECVVAALDDDVEHGVQPAGAGQRRPEVALGDRDRDGLSRP